MTITSRLEPFTATQTIYVMDSDKILEMRKVSSISEFYEVISDLSNKYSAERIAIAGDENYLSKIAANLESKFDCGCPIEII